jgi:acyl-CoA hydrolase
MSDNVDKIYEHHMLVRQEHLNQYGGLFGGVVLSTIDELAFIACSRAFPGKNFLTRAVQNAEFEVASGLGDILEFSFHVEKVGNTSVTVHVRMSICKDGDAPVTAFDGRVVLVCVDASFRPTPVR